MRHARVYLAAAVVSLIASSALAKGPKDYVMMSPDQATFTPVDLKNPDGPQVAIVSGNPKAGPVAVYLRYTKGRVAPHWHSSDAFAVLVDGELVHWQRGHRAQAATAHVGTAWFQPGGSVATAHADECMSDTCTVFVTMTGKFDSRPAPKHPDDDRDALGTIAGGNGLPAECGRYKDVMLKMMQCPQMPQASREALKQGYDAMAQGWANAGALPPDAMQAMAEGCRQGADALEQAGRSVCGW
jgi:hypothetical protein